MNLVLRHLRAIAMKEKIDKFDLLERFIDYYKPYLKRYYGDHWFMVVRGPLCINKLPLKKQINYCTKPIYRDGCIDCWIELFTHFDEVVNKDKSLPKYLKKRELPKFLK
jgi:hypothetical protein